MTSKLLNHHQARWAEFLSRFNFQITYRPGKHGGKPDALTRRSRDLPKEGDEAFNNNTSVLKPQNLGPGITTFESEVQTELKLWADNLPSAGLDPLRDLFKQAYKVDKMPTEVLQVLQQGDQHYPEITLAECENRKGILYYQGCLLVPNYDKLRLHLMRSHHDSSEYGHPGRALTLDLLQREYYWETIRWDVDGFVRNCDTCHRSHTARHAPIGLI